uniref:Uncharacterized protein n=1 Tax=Cyprinodon variegatus TaxID=28743 RepID=A0A3Q2GC74_CYPVA
MALCEPPEREWGLAKAVTNVLMSLDVLQHSPLLVVAVVPSLGIGLELLDGRSGSSAGAHLVNRGRDSLTEPALDGPDLTEDLKQHRPHALVHADTFRGLGLGARLGWDAVSHGREKEGRGGGDHGRPAPPISNLSPNLTSCPV